MIKLLSKVASGLLLCLTATAQLRVTVHLRDATDAAVASVSVRSTCGPQTAWTDASGMAEFLLPEKATCTFTASASDFRPAARTIAIVEDAEVNLQLEPLIVRTAMVVSAGADALGTSSTSAHGSLNSRQIALTQVLGGATAFTDLITRTTPGVAADSNGFAHPLGEHADTSLSIDGQPVTDQQAKVFSNQIDPQIIETMTATTGEPPAEFGDKTSLVISIVTKSGLGRGSFGAGSIETGSFGTVAPSFSLGAGRNRWGNFVAVSGSTSRRFLDGPEFQAMHDDGHHFNIFDRLDWQPRQQDAFHVNLMGGQSGFETPNSFDTESAGQRQRSAIANLSAALIWNRVLSPRALFSLTAFARGDHARYFPSPNPLADKPATLQQDRTLRNRGVRAEIAAVSRNHNGKLGAVFTETPLREKFAVGITDSLFNSVCAAADAPQIRSTEECSSNGLSANPYFVERLLPYDLTRGGTLYRFDRSAVVGQAAFYLQDEWKHGAATVSAGLRYDLYRGLSRGRQLAPRIGVAWRAPNAGTVLRASYARLFETPYNENLIFANDAGGDGNPFGTYRSEPVRPGTRNQFNTGFSQEFGRHIAVDADYYWKFTRTAFDFDTLFNTPITFSVAWRKSKIDGLALRVNLLNVHGLTAYSVMGHVRSRFFGPQVGGLVFGTASSSDAVFRIDHGEEFEQTTSLRYQFEPHKLGRWRPWANFVWRYNSGLALPDTVPDYTNALALTANEQYQIGARCGAEFSTPTHAIRTCSADLFSASRIRIPAPGKHNEDSNPVRVAARSLFDLSAGEDELWKHERLTLGARATAINVTNRIALYNFLSTFSGTHFVPPRSITVALTARF